MTDLTIGDALNEFAANLTTLEDDISAVETAVAALQAGQSDNLQTPVFIISDDQENRIQVGKIENKFGGAGTFGYDDNDFREYFTVSQNGSGDLVFYRSAKNIVADDIGTTLIVPVSHLLGATNYSYQMRFYLEQRGVDVWGVFPDLLQGINTPVAHNATVVPGSATVPIHVRSTHRMNASQSCRIEYNRNGNWIGSRLLLCPNDDALTELIIQIPADHLLEGQDMQIRIVLSATIKGYRAGVAQPAMRYYTVHCRSNLSDYVEPAAIPQTDPLARVKRRAGRGLVKAMTDDIYFNIGQNVGSYTGGGQQGDKPCYSDGNGENDSYNSAAWMGVRNNGANPLRAVDGRIEMWGEYSPVGYKNRANGNETRYFVSSGATTRGMVEWAYGGYAEMWIANGDLKPSSCVAGWSLGALTDFPEFDWGEFGLGPLDCWTANRHDCAPFIDGTIWYEGYNSDFKFAYGVDDTGIGFPPGDVTKLAMDWNRDDAGRVWVTILINDALSAQYRAEMVITRLDDGTMINRAAANFYDFRLNADCYPQPIYMIFSHQIGPGLTNVIDPAHFFPFNPHSYAAVEDWRIYQSTAEIAGDTTIKNLWKYPSAMMHAPIAAPSREMRIYASPLNSTVATTGTPVSFRLRPTAARDGHSFAWSITSYHSPLPAGVTFDPATGEVGGLPSEPGMIDVTVRCTDTIVGDYAEKRHTLSVGTLLKITDFLEGKLHLDFTDDTLLTLDQNSKVTAIAKVAGTSTSSIVPTGEIFFYSDYFLTGPAIQAAPAAAIQTGIRHGGGSFTLSFMGLCGGNDWLIDVASRSGNQSYLSVRANGPDYEFVSGPGFPDVIDGFNGSSAMRQTTIWFDAPSDTLRFYVSDVLTRTITGQGAASLAGVYANFVLLLADTAPIAMRNFAFMQSAPGGGAKEQGVGGTRTIGDFIAMMAWKSGKQGLLTDDNPRRSIPPYA